MAIDNKYGRVTLEHSDIGEDEPVVVFRARDMHLPKLLMYYHLFCLKTSRTPRLHLDLILDSLEKIQAWQDEHPLEVRHPSSSGYKRRMEGGDDGG